MLVVSFATVGPYEAELDAMLATLPPEVETYTEIIAPRSWRDATLYKPRYILDRLCRSVSFGIERPVVWLDADARVEQPAAFVAEVESLAVANPGRVGFHRLVRIDPDPRGPECVLSTIIFAPPLWKCLPLVVAWLAACQDRPGERTPEQEPMELLLVPDHATEYLDDAWFDLPPTLCWIDARDPAIPMDVSAGRYGKREPIVRQTQASRRLKNA